MAKAIEQTPILEGADAKRFITLLSQREKQPRQKDEKEVRAMAQHLPRKLKLQYLS